jgi:hypothetical protein
MSKTVWGYTSQSVPAERWDGMCDSREQAILEGRAEYGGERFWITSGTQPDAEMFLPSVDSIIEQMGENAFGEAGECSEDFPCVSKEAEAELEALLAAWARKHCEVNFWIEDGSEPEEIPALEEK